MFTFELTDSGKLLPVGADGTHFDDDKYCSNTSISGYNGIACTNRALYDAAFWK